MPEVAEREEIEAEGLSEESEGRGGGMLARLGRLVALVAAIAAAAAGILHFAFDVNPSLSPDPNEKLRADLEPLSVEQLVPLGEYLDRIDRPGDVERLVDRTARSLAGGSTGLKCARRQLLAYRGIVVYTGATVEGLKHRDVLLDAVLYNARSGRPVPRSELDQRVPIPARHLSSPADHFVTLAFVAGPVKPARHAYFVRLQLREVGQKGTMLAMGDTPRFALRSYFGAEHNC